VALVLDTGVLYAALDASDPDHKRCADLLEHASEDLLIPAPVLVELDYWVRKFASAATWLEFVEQVTDGAFVVYGLDDGELLGAARLQARYPAVRLGFVDAAVFVTCQSLNETKVATLDRRHFSLLRTEEGRALEILPD
jgi:predicted nucleic acid-binding protein